VPFEENVIVDWSTLNVAPEAGTPFTFACALNQTVLPGLIAVPLKSDLIVLTELVGHGCPQETFCELTLPDPSWSVFQFARAETVCCPAGTEIGIVFCPDAPFSVNSCAVTTAANIATITAADLTCTGVTFHYTHFNDVLGTPAANVPETITVDGNTVYQQTFTVPSDVFDHFVPISVGPGTHTITAEAVPPTGIRGFASGTVTCGKTFSIGPSSMEGHILIAPGDWVNGGYSFKFKNGSHIATQYTVAATVSLQGKCPDGSTGTITFPLQTITHNVPANNTDWLPTGDANSVLSWQGSVRVGIDVPAPCPGGGKLDNSKGATFTATVSQNPPTGSLVDFRFKYRDPAAKGKPNTNCLDTSDPNRNRADVCGASWSQTVTDP
jgi:hypothetical protein